MNRAVEWSFHGLAYLPLSMFGAAAALLAMAWLKLAWAAYVRR